MFKVGQKEIKAEWGGGVGRQVGCNKRASPTCHSATKYLDGCVGVLFAGRDSGYHSVVQHEQKHVPASHAHMQPLVHANTLLCTHIHDKE